MAVTRRGILAGIVLAPFVRPLEKPPQPKGFYYPFLGCWVRTALPAIIAHELVSVQPMCSPQLLMDLQFIATKPCTAR